MTTDAGIDKNPMIVLDRLSLVSIRAVTCVLVLLAGCRTTKPAASVDPGLPGERGFADERVEAQGRDDGPAPSSIDDVEVQPIESVRDNAIYDPSPDIKRLAQTEAAEWQDPVSTTVLFCVGHDGVAVDQRVVEASGDAEVDEIALDAVRKWRYRPFLVDGKPVKVCTTVTFNFKFE